jgi:molecular chaperone HtpG
LKNNVEIQKNKIQLYSNQVFVTDSVEGIVPDFLTLLHGVIDSPDIPLNVSRSYLQSDSNVKKIAAHISKKVSDKLEEMFKNDRADFEKKWDDIKVFIQYGMLTEEKFFERANKFALVKNIDSKYFTIEEYQEKIKPLQTDKNNRLVILYTNDKKAQHTFIEPAVQRGYDVIEMDGPLAPHYISKIEHTIENCSFARVDSDTIDRLISKHEDLPSKLTNEEQEAIKPVFQKDLDTKKFNVTFESMSETDQPAVVTQTEFMRRMKEQEAMGGGGFYGTLPEMYNVVINANHPIITKIKESADVAVKEQMAKQVVDLALLSQGMLKGEDLTRFVKRSIELIGKE